MAAHTAEFSVSALSDVGELRPKDDQAVVFDIQRTIPNKEYVFELNKHIKDDSSFIYASRISRDRLCVVMRDAAQAAMLVEKVGHITVQEFKTQINFLVAKAIKVNISNAGYGITNSALKRYLTNYCKIRTASSVSEQKANIDTEGGLFKNCKSFRRIVYIHPDDVNKLPNGPVKFTTPAISFNVFFDIDTPKCFACGQADHFRQNCPKNLEKEEQNENNLNSKTDQRNQQVAKSTSGESTSAGSIEDETADAVDDAGKNKALEQLSAGSSAQRPAMREAGATPPLFTDVFKSSGKRQLSATSSEKSLPLKETELDLFLEPYLPTHDSLTQRKKTENSSSKKNNKKMKVEQMNEEDRTKKLTALLEPARAHIEASAEHHLLDFVALARMLAYPHKTPIEERKKRARAATKHIPELVELLKVVHSLVSGKGIKSKITGMKNAFLNEEHEDSQSEYSLASELEHSDSSLTNQMSLE